MKAKKLWALSLVGAMAAGSLAGCGNNSNNANADATNAATDAAKTDAAATDAATPAETKKVNLTVWAPQEEENAYDGYKDGLLQTLCKNFNDAHPEWDITFKFDPCPESEAYNNINKDVDAAPDVYMFANDQIPSLVKINALAQLGGTTVDDIKNNNEEVISQSVTYKDGIYGVPFTSNTYFMFYDKKLYTEDEAKSLDTMMAKDLGDGVSNFAMALDNSWYAPSFFFGAGCTLFGEDGTDGTKGCDFNNEKGVEAGKYLVNLVSSDKFSLEKDQSSLAKMKDRKLGAYVTGSWDAETIKKYLGDDMGVTVLPTINVNGADSSLLSFGGSKCIGVNPNGENTDVAAALAAYLGSEEVQQIRYEVRNIIPSNKTVSASEEVQKDPIAQAQNAEILEHSKTQPVVDEMQAFWDPASSFFKELCNKSITADNVQAKLDSMAEGINK